MDSNSAASIAKIFNYVGIHLVPNFPFVLPFLKMISGRDLSQTVINVSCSESYAFVNSTGCVEANSEDGAIAVVFESFVEDEVNFVRESVFLPYHVDLPSSTMLLLSTQ